MYKKSELIKKQYSTGEVAKILNRKPQTIIHLDKQGKLPFKRTEGNRRTMFREDLIDYLEKKGLLIDDEMTLKYDLIYARVSSHEQKEKGDLDRQVVKVMEFAIGMNIQTPYILKEVGSGLNDNRKQIQKLIKIVMEDKVSGVFINYKDRLTRFGFNYLEVVFKIKV